MCGCHPEFVWMFGDQLFHTSPLNLAGLRGVAVRRARRALTATPSATVDSPPSTPYKVLRTLDAERDARFMRLVLPSNLNRHRETKTRRRAQVTR
jgi:hypothetical protein